MSLAAAAASRGAPPDLAIAQMRKDKKEAVRLARLKMKASARGAAPPPPPPGSKKAPPPVAVPGAGDGEPVKVEKYRAVSDYSGEISFPKGATLFVLGNAENGKVMAVYNGASGMCDFSVLTIITDELLAKERAATEEAAAAARAQREAAASGDLEAIEAEAALAAAALEAKHATVDDTAANEKAAASAAAKAKYEEEAAAAKAEEDRIKAEAARLEELMRALDDSDED